MTLGEEVEEAAAVVAAAFEEEVFLKSGTAVKLYKIRYAANFKTSLGAPYSGGTGGGGGGVVTALIMIGVCVAIFVLIYICICVSLAFEEDEYEGYTGPRTPCYLCLSGIPDGPWKDKSHRRDCATRNRQELDSMPKPYNVRCPNCSHKLRQWPKKGPEVRELRNRPKCSSML